MDIHFIDTIVEDHITRSLMGGLERLGHRVTGTGKIWEGADFPTEPRDVRRLARVVDGVIRARPDAVFVMRACALLPEQVRRLRRAGITTVVWFSDDPVFYEKQGVVVGAEYDITLHTATAPLLWLYEVELGVVGLGFQFWASQDDFPRTYDPAACDKDLVFIGNTHTPVKRWRYDFIAGLPVDAVMYGRSGGDPRGIVAGLILDPSELAAASTRGRFGLSVGQRFEDYEGSPFAYDGLLEMGEFALPSRIIQLASAGVPVVSVIKYPHAKQDLKVLFPPVRVVRSQKEVVDLVATTGNDKDALRRLSDETYDWYAEHYTETSRALFLHRALRDPQRYRALDPKERATAFLRVTTPGRATVRAIRTRVVLERTAKRAVRKARRLVRKGLGR